MPLRTDTRFKMHTYDDIQPTFT